MSRDFFLQCKTCIHDQRWGYGADLNWQQYALCDLVPHLPAFAAIAKLGFDIDPDTLSLHGSYKPRGIGAWALKHIGHAVTVVDEYGETWGLCGFPVICGSCAASHRCDQPTNHPGACTTTTVKAT